MYGLFTLKQPVSKQTDGSPSNPSSMRSPRLRYVCVLTESVGGDVLSRGKLSIVTSRNASSPNSTPRRGTLVVADPEDHLTSLAVEFSAGIVGFEVARDYLSPFIYVLVFLERVVGLVIFLDEGDAVDYRWTRRPSTETMLRPPPPMTSSYGLV